MNSDWETKLIGQICSIKRGASPRPIHEWITEGNGISWVKISDANSNNGNVINQTASKIRNGGNKHSVEVFPGDLILSNSASPGIPRIMGIYACIHDGWLLLRDFKGVEKDFLFYLLEKERSKLLAKGNGSVFTNLKTDILREHKISLPPINEQKSIANILGILDEKIVLNKKTNETLEGIAKALFKSWFIGFDPVRAKAEDRSTGLPDDISDLFPDSFEDSASGQIPNSWDIKKIADWGETICGKTPSTKNESYYGSDYMFVTIPDLHKGLHVTSSSKGLSKSGAELQSKKLLSKGSILVSCIATPGLIGVIQESCFTNQQINSITPNNKNCTWFIAFFLLMNKDLLLSFGGGGSVFFNLNKSKFDSIEIISPPEKIIDKFNQFVSPLMDKCFALKREISFLSNMRNTLLPKLISGELRIPDAEKMIDEVLI